MHAARESFSFCIVTMAENKKAQYAVKPVSKRDFMLLKLIFRLAEMFGCHHLFCNLIKM